MSKHGGPSPAWIAAEAKRLTDEENAKTQQQKSVVHTTDGDLYRKQRDIARIRVDYLTGILSEHDIKIPEAVVDPHLEDYLFLDDEEDSSELLEYKKYFREYYVANNTWRAINVKLSAANGRLSARHKKDLEIIARVPELEKEIEDLKSGHKKYEETIRLQAKEIEEYKSLLREQSDQATVFSGQVFQRVTAIEEHAPVPKVSTDDPWYSYHEILVLEDSPKWTGAQRSVANAIVNTTIPQAGCVIDYSLFIQTILPATSDIQYVEQKSIYSAVRRVVRVSAIVSRTVRGLRLRRDDEKGHAYVTCRERPSHD